jgi:hypothetical protein
MSTDIADRSVEAPGLHAAAVYDSEASLRARATPFLRAGVDRGEAVQAGTGDTGPGLLRR